MGALFILVGLGCICYGIFRIKKPASGWRRNEGWKAEGDSEPSEAYLMMAKLGGLIALVAGVVFLGTGILNLIY